MAALTITHHIAAPLEVVPSDLGLKAQNLTQAIQVLEVVDAATFEAGNRLLVEAHQAAKDLEAARVRLKKPITDLGREIDRIVASVADPLGAAKRSMQGKVAAYQRKLQAEADAIRREAEEKARIEREAAEKERQRLQAIADADHAAKVAELKAKAAAEATELEAILGRPVEAKPVEVGPAPKIELPATPAPATVAVVAPAKPSAVQIRTVQKLVIDDEAAVPAYVSGINVRPIDTAAVKKLLAAGVTVPGCRMVAVEEIGRAHV